MRKPQQLVKELAEDLKANPGVTVAQHATHNGRVFWPELHDPGFRLELEELMIQVPGVKEVFFSMPQHEFDWAFYVVPNENGNG